MCDEAAMLTIVDTQVPRSLSRETNVFSSWLCFVIRWKQNVHLHSFWWPYSLSHISFISNKFISDYGSTLPATIMCVWTKTTFWKMSNMRHFNNTYLSHKRVDLAHVFRVYRQQKQIETTATKNTEKLYLCCHLYHKQICTAVICSIMSPSKIVTWRDFAICSLRSILRPWKGFLVTIYIRKFVNEVS
jgi:hypothetical protein